MFSREETRLTNAIIVRSPRGLEETITSGVVEWGPSKLFPKSEVSGFEHDLARRYSCSRSLPPPPLSPDMEARIGRFGYQTGHKLIPSNVFVR